MSDTEMSDLEKSEFEESEFEKSDTGVSETSLRETKVRKTGLKRSRVRTAQGLGALLLLLGVIVFGWVFSQQIPLDRIGVRMEEGGAGAVLIFLLAGVMATAIGLPRQGLAFVAGFAWGVVPGLALSLAAAIGGCALTSEVSRRWFSRPVADRYPRVVAQLARLTRRDAFLKIIVLRIQPLGTNFLTNLCAGLTPIPRHVFLGASFVGYIPQMLVFTLLGSGVRVGSGSQLLVSGVLLVISLVLGYVLYRRHLQSVGTID